jgi:hypothetical protein
MWYRPIAAAKKKELTPRVDQKSDLIVHLQRKGYSDKA